MNFFWKLYFSIMLIVTVCFGIGGYVLIQSSFHTSLGRETEAAYQENDILYISFERILSTNYGAGPAAVFDSSALDADALSDELSAVLQNVAENILSLIHIFGILPSLHTKKQRAEKQLDLRFSLRAAYVLLDFGSYFSIHFFFMPMLFL